MKLQDARRLAIDLMIEHGLISQGWSFRFDNSKKTMGWCRPVEMEITLSKIITSAASEETVKDTILHEIAHAIVGTHHGHDHVWRKKAVEIGCKGTRGEKWEDLDDSIKDAMLDTSKYTLECKSCGLKVPKSRRPKRSQSCAICHPKGYSAKYKLELKQNY